ncbi:MAG: class I SAM-dependent methyltransferase [Sphingobacteriales bacterium]|nr:MAG: class I SAM-dependent methyltransferase [Sphingobacteriales bacterium]
MEVASIYIYQEMSSLDKKQVEEFFTTAAKKHKNENAVLDVAMGQEHSNIYRNYFTKKYILKNLAAKKTQTILDFGCGVGRITNQLSQKAREVVGVDSNAAMLETAVQKFNYNKNIRYELLNEIKVSSDENYFNAIFSHWVFQHINDDESIKWLIELKRVLRNDGRILLFEQIKNETTESTRHSFRSGEHYKTLFEKAELKTTSAYPVMRVPARGMSVWNKLPSIKFLLPILSYIDTITINRKPALADYFTYCFVLSK